MSMLQVQGLTKHYPSFTLEDISFSLAPGRIMGLIGVNGAGKSTTLKSLVGLVHPDAGCIKLLGRPFPAEETAIKQEIGVVLGEAAYYGNKRIRTITAVTKRFYTGWNEAAYRRYLKLFRLDEAKQVKELSSGMRVKYALALALSHGARLLILDEPTSGLDPVSRDEVLQLLRALVEDGHRSVLFSTHITTDLEKCADDITYIQEGRMVESAQKAAFQNSFAHLLEPGEDGPLSLEEIMLRSERRSYNGKAFG